MTAIAARSVESPAAQAQWSATDLVHALAQLPPDVSLELEVEARERATVELLAAAYGVGDRLAVRASGGPGRCRFEGTAAGSTVVVPGRTMAELVESLWPLEAERSAVDGDDRVLSGHRIAVVTNVPTHYRVPLFNGLADRLGRVGADLRVFFMGAPPAAQPWLESGEEMRFDHEYVSSAVLPRWVPLSSDVDRVRPPHVPRGLGRRLGAFGPSLVVAGSFSFSGMAAYAYAARRGVPFGIWSGDVPQQQANRSYRALRSRQRRWLVRKADFGISYGWLAARYLDGLAPGLPVVIARNTSVIDVPDRPLADRRECLEVLAVADLTVPEKGFETVVEAMRLARDANCRLRVIGNPPAGELARAAAQDPRIEFCGALSHDEVNAAYARSDVFVFPSRMDIFGLALPEAMAAGLPCITSVVPGSVADLAVDGKNCVIVPPRDARGWADAIISLAESPSLRESLGAAAQATIRRRWTMAHAVEGTAAAFRLGALKAGGAA